VAGSMDRRSFLARSAAVAGGVIAAGAGGELLGACGNATAAGAAGTRSAASRDGITRARPRRGGSLVFGVTAEESGFNPTAAKFDSVGVMYARTVYDPLTIITADGGWAPYLAESVVPNADYSEWTVTLRPNVLFHDTTPCDAAAYYQNVEAQLKGAITGLVLPSILESFSQTGPLSLKLTMKTPWVPFPFYLAGGIGGQPAYLMAPAMINTKTSTDHPIGTGPFKFQEWIPNTHFTATAWEHYWRPGMPYLDRITFKPIPDGATRAEALQAGTIDIMVTDTPKNILSFRDNAQWSYIDSSASTLGEPTVTCLLLNLSKPPFDNPNARLAAAKAVNRSEYAKVINYGVDRLADGLFVPGSPYYSKTNLPTYDPSAAKKLLAQVAHQTGGPVSFTLGTTNSPAAIRAGTFLQQQFQNVGFKVSTTVVEQNKLIDDALFGTFQALEWRQFGAVNPDLNYVFWSTTTYNPHGLSINMARNDDPRVQAALEIGRTNPNAETRVKAYQKVNQLLVQDLPYLWATWSTWAIVAHPTVENFNNPTTPAGGKAYGLTDGSIWPTQIWIS